MPSYTGTSIENKPAWLLRNEKFHRAIHREYVPTIEETLQHIGAWRDWHRSQPCPHVKGKTIGQVFDEGRGPGVDINKLDDLMLAIKKGSINRNGIRFLNADYYSDDLYGLRESVVIHYSLFDLSHIKVYSSSGQIICTARRVMRMHPMASYLGDVRDVEDLKQALTSQRKLERKTIQTTKELLRRGKPFEIGWDQIANLSPNVIGKIEEENMTLPETTERIPDEAIKNNAFNTKQGDQHEQAEPFTVGAERPFFGLDVIARYQWHLENGFNKEEDLIFKQEFEKTNTYRMSFKFFEDQGAVAIDEKRRQKMQVC
jgi:hypothetical protein